MKTQYQKHVKPLPENKRLAIRLHAFSALLLNRRMPSEPSAVTREMLYDLNKLLLDISAGLADESRRLDPQ